MPRVPYLIVCGSALLTSTAAALPYPYQVIVALREADGVFIPCGHSDHIDEVLIWLDFAAANAAPGVAALRAARLAARCAAVARFSAVAIFAAAAARRTANAAVAAAGAEGASSASHPIAPPLESGHCRQRGREAVD